MMLSFGFGYDLVLQFIVLSLLASIANLEPLEIGIPYIFDMKYYMAE